MKRFVLVDGAKEQASISAVTKRWCFLINS